MDQRSKEKVAQGWFLWKIHVKITLCIWRGEQMEKLIDCKAQSSEWIKNLETNSRKQVNVANRNLVSGVRKVTVPQYSLSCVPFAPSAAWFPIWDSCFNRDLDKPKVISRERLEAVLLYWEKLWGRKQLEGRTSWALHSNCWLQLLPFLKDDELLKGPWFIYLEFPALEREEVLKIFMLNFRKLNQTIFKYLKSW